jgi:hypothetical protein
MSHEGSTLNKYSWKEEDNDITLGIFLNYNIQYIAGRRMIMILLWEYFKIILCIAGRRMIMILLWEYF